MLDRKNITSLLKPSAYPEPTKAVSLMQTHISYLFLTDRFVYKVKKDVNLGFLDFSTLELRHHFCQEEVRLNARLCPGIYQKVVPVVRTETGAAFDRDGEVIDYAVKMIRLPAERMLDRLVEHNEATEDDIRAVARTIADFHGRAERSPDIDAGGTPERLLLNCSENFQQLVPYIGRTISAHLLSELQSWTDGWLSHRRGLFASRIDEGFIRDCDGDIHLGNICLWDHPYIFDCIEFNERFRHIDTAADIAFFLMDLDCHGRMDLSFAALNEYRTRSGDRHLDCILPFFKVYRAVVRAKIASITLDVPDLSDAARAAALTQARRYLDLARHYMAMAPVRPQLVITCGPMGSGKSSVAEMLSPRIAAVTLSSDRIRKEMAGIPLDTHAHAAYNEGVYSPAFSNAVYLELLSRAGSELRAGCSVIVDASFQRQGDRDLFRNLADSCGVDFHIIASLCDEETIRHRLQERTKHRHSISDGRWQLYPLQLRDFAPIDPDHPDTFILDTSRTREAILADLVSHFGADHAATNFDGPPRQASA